MSEALKAMYDSQTTGFAPVDLIMTSTSKSKPPKEITSITVLRVEGNPSLVDGIVTPSLGALWKAAIYVREKYKIGNADDHVFIPYFNLEFDCKIKVIEWTGARPDIEHMFHPKDYEITFKTDQDRLFFLIRWNG